MAKARRQTAQPSKSRKMVRKSTTAKAGTRKAMPRRSGGRRGY